MITNALNLLDNMDGLSAGIAALAALACTMDLMGTSLPLAAYAAAVAGGAAGFLVFNFKPASIFMGDSGSLFRGQPRSPVAHGGRQAGTGRAVRSRRSGLSPADPDFRHDPRYLLTHSLHAFGVTGWTRSHLPSTRRDGILGVGGGAHSVGPGGGRWRDRHPGPLFPLLRGASARSAAPHWSRAARHPAGARARVHGEDFSLLLGRPYTPLLVDVTYKRRIFEILLDLILTMFSYYAAYIIRFDRDVGLYYGLFTQSLPIVIACQLSSFFVSGVYRGSWRYISLADLTTYAKAIALAVLSSVMVLVYAVPVRRIFPRRLRD